MISPRPNTAPEPRRAALDVFRGVAALTIVLHHLFSTFALPGIGTPFAYVAKALSLGWIAVDAFFVLSGYLIGSILLRERGAHDYHKTFYARRCFRVLPLYFLLVALFLGLRGLGPGWQIDPYAAGDPIPAWSYWVLAQNQFMAMHADLGTITLGLTWSLAVEEQFYLIMPLLVALLGPRRLPGFLLGCMLFAILLRFGSGGMTSYVLLPTRMDSLMAGVLLAVLTASPRAREQLDTHRRALGAGGAVLALAGAAWLLLTNREISFRLLEAPAMRLGRRLFPQSALRPPAP